MQRNYDFVFKVVLLGPSATGKTALLKRYADDQFEENMLTTIGVDFKFKSFNLEDNFIKLQLWDTAGQERFKAVVKSHYRDADAVILVYDAQNALSLQEIEDYWLDQVRRTVKKDCVIYIFANKCDSPKFGISREHRQLFAREKIKCFEVSAKTGKSVQESVHSLVSHLTKVKPRLQDTKIVMSLNEYTPSRKKGCC